MRAAPHGAQAPPVGRALHSASASLEQGAAWLGTARAGAARALLSALVCAALTTGASSAGSTSSTASASSAFTASDAPTAGTAASRLSAPAPDTRRSGFVDMGPSTQALQRDDTLNPAFLWLQDGQQRFAQDCARCHQPDELRGVAARYPAFDERLARPLTLAGRIQQCQVRHVRPRAPAVTVEPLTVEGDALLGLELFVAHRSRGLPLTPPPDARLAPWQEQGRQLYHQRIGQLDLSCADCHDRQAGGRLGGSTIPQGHPTAYPIYRLEWQAVGSLQRRLRNCQAGVRAQTDAYGSEALTALELFLVQRAAGMLLETPGVRP